MELIHNRMEIQSLPISIRLYNLQEPRPSLELPGQGLPCRVIDLHKGAGHFGLNAIGLQTPSGKTSVEIQPMHSARTFHTCQNSADNGRLAPPCPIRPSEATIEICGISETSEGRLVILQQGGYQEMGDWLPRKN